MDYCSKISKNLFISDMPFDLASSNEKSKYFSTFFWIASKSFWVVLQPFWVVLKSFIDSFWVAISFFWVVTSSFMQKRILIVQLLLKNVIFYNCTILDNPIVFDAYDITQLSLNISLYGQQRLIIFFSLLNLFGGVEVYGRGVLYHVVLILLHRFNGVLK